MQHRLGFGVPALALMGLALAVLAVGLAQVLRVDVYGERGSGLSERFTYDLEAFERTDPALIKWRPTRQFTVPLDDPRAVAVGPEDRIYVAGDHAVVVFSPDGQKLQQIKIPGEPRCLAVAGAGSESPGRVYVGLQHHVEVYDPQGNREAIWRPTGSDGPLTSIALGEHEVFVADAGGRIVLRYDAAGKPLGRIGARDESQDIPGLVIPSPYFDVALGADGLLRVVNPGGHRIESYTPDGRLELAWGKASLGIEGFCGCCNPANIAILPDGNIVTAEKGIPRVKVYAADGEFLSVVAGPELLLPAPHAATETRSDHKLKVIDVAADSRGRILVLDPQTRSVRIFQPKSEPAAKAEKDNGTTRSRGGAEEKTEKSTK